MPHPEITLPPYAEAIGVALDSWNGNAPVLAADYSEAVCGNPGTFHGGALSAMLEMAAMATLAADLRTKQSPARLTMLNTTVEFMRSAGEARTYASATIVRSGRRFANMQAWLWQETAERPVATALINILIQPEDS